jgi:hypothetical protein
MFSKLKSICVQAVLTVNRIVIIHYRQLGFTKLIYVISHELLGKALDLINEVDKVCSNVIGVHLIDVITILELYNHF